MEKASTYVFAERLIRNAEVRGSTRRSTIESTTYGRRPLCLFQLSRTRRLVQSVDQIFNCSTQGLGRVRIATSHSNIRPTKDFSQRECIGSAVCRTSGGSMAKIMKRKSPIPASLLALSTETSGRQDDLKYSR